MPKPDDGGASASDVEAAKERERRGLIEILGGGGMPLEELGLLLVPPLSKVEIETRYGALIEQGKAKAKGKLVNLIWETVKKSPTMQIYLSKVMLGWNEKSGVGEPKTPEPLESEAGNSPPANSNMPSRLDLNRIFPAPGRK